MGYKRTAFNYYLNEFGQLVSKQPRGLKYMNMFKT